MPFLRRALLALIAALSLNATLASAQEAADAAPLPMGILIRNPDTSAGEPPYALVDQFGRTQRLVEPTRSIDLGPFVGSRVHVRHDTGQTLLASQLELPTSKRELRTVSPAQFVPPRRLAKLDDAPRQRSKPRRFAVVPAQLTDGADRYLSDAAENLPGDSTEPIDLDSVMASEESDSLPSPSDGSRLEPIPAGDYPAGDYYEELPSTTTVSSGHDPNCPHCAKQRNIKPNQVSSHSDACPTCRAKVAPLVTKCRHCGGGAGWCGPSCNPASRRGVYGRIDYMLWWFDGMATPPLATTNSLGNAPALGQPGTSIVYGGELLDDERSGVRLTVGAWLDDRRDIAIEADWLSFETASASFAGGGIGGAASLGRPFYNLFPSTPTPSTGPREDVQIINSDDFDGTLAIPTRSEFETFGIRLRTGMCCRDIGGCDPCGCASCCGEVGGLVGGRKASAISRVDFTLGYRYADLDESLGFNENVVRDLDDARLVLGESFATSNTFHGLELGLVYDWQATRWGLELGSRLAVGGTRQQLAVRGSQTISDADNLNSITSPGGLYTQTSNIGDYQRDRFSVLPELSARVTYRITPRMRLSAGYSLLYWANVLRPGDQIDTTIDPRQIDPATVAGLHPLVDLEETSFWAHGFNLGLDYQY